MECIFKVDEKDNQQWLEVQQERGEGSRFESVFRIDGQPILPPLMTPERQLEMQQYRDAAIAIEQRRALKLSNIRKSQSNLELDTLKTLERNANARQFVDASTNTEGDFKPDPKQTLTVIGRLTQVLQRSETLIYDNKRNAIIKILKPNERIKGEMLIIENHPIMAQTAVIIDSYPKFGIIQDSYTLEAVEPEPEPELEAKSEPTPTPSRSCVPEQCRNKENGPPNPRRSEGIVRQLKRNMTQNDLLQRSCTSPLLPSKAERNAALKDSIQSQCYSERGERLHPNLWKRYNSYNIGARFGSVANTAPCSPRSTAVIQPESSKIQIKEQHATEDNMKSKLCNVLQPKPSGSTKVNKRTPRASSTVSNPARASYHANTHAQMGSTDSSPRISSTQRRLSYDPRATLKRSTIPKKVVPSHNTRSQSPSHTSNSSSSQASPQSMPQSPNSNSELIKRTIDDMDQSQRQRINLLVTHQAEEQHRLKKQFIAQQKLLMDEMMCDMNIYKCDQDEDLDHANSDCSSINSLQQNRFVTDIEQDKESNT